MKRFLAVLVALALALAPSAATAQLLLTGAGAAPSSGGGGVTAAFRSTSQVASGSPTFTLPMPAGAQAGDVILILSDNSASLVSVVTMGSGAVLTATNTISTSYGTAYAYAYKLVAGDIGSDISIVNITTSDSYWVAVDYSISGGSVATITSQDQEIVSSGSLTFASFTPSGTTITTVCLMFTFGAFTYSTPAGWTADVNNTNVPASPGFGIGSFSKAGGNGPTFTGFTSQAFGVEFELAS